MVANTIFPKKDRRHFTEAARAAALEARRKAKEKAKEEGEGFDALKVFVFRFKQNDKRFVFEIRQFGGVVVHRSNNSFANFNEALNAGKETLLSMKGNENGQSVPSTQISSDSRPDTG